MVEKNWTPSKSATLRFWRSRKWKLPSIRFTRFIWGAAAPVDLRAVFIEPDAVGAGDVSIPLGVAGLGAVEVSFVATGGSGSGERRVIGRCHFPDSFCGQTTIGLVSATFLITSGRQMIVRGRT